MKKNFITMLALLAIAMLATACGGGSGGSSDESGGGVGTTGGQSAPAYKSLGAISALGSIVVNGVKFEIEDAHIIIDGAHVDSKSLLKVGMKVEVEGEVNDDRITGRASEVRFDCDVEGPIESSVASASGLAKTLVVMGQTVEVEDGFTKFDDSAASMKFATLDDSSVGNVIEVSGARDANGVIHAGFIQKKADDVATFLANDLFEVKGRVTNLSDTSFMIGNLTINFSGVTPRNLENAPGGALGDGVMVEVKGSILSGGTLMATDIEVKANGLGLDDLPEAEIEGLIEAFDAASEMFMIHGQKISFRAASFVGGVKADLMNGVEVEVEGPVVAGVLNAVKIKFEENIRFEANVDAVNAAAGSLTLQNLAGITIIADDFLTEFKDTADLSGIAVGNNVKIRGRLGSSSNTVIATRLELKDVAPDKRLIIQGPVSSVDAATRRLTILGIDIDASQAEGAFNLIKVGSIVKAKADVSPILAWKEIEIED